MAKATFGEYAAFTVGNRGIRYQKNNKLIAGKDVPPEVVVYLDKQLAAMGGETMLKPPVESQPEVESHQEVENPTTDAQQPPTDATGEPLPRADEPVPTDEFSIHAAPLEDIARALYERFGVWTVFLGEFPKESDISPITSEIMTRYDRGVAYNAAKRANARGLLNRDLEASRLQMVEAPAYDSTPAPRDFHTERQENSFAYRMSVESQRDRIPATRLEHYQDETGRTRVRRVNGATTVEPDGQYGVDEPTVNPDLKGTPIIRPDW